MLNSMKSTRTNPAALLRDLIRCPSVTPQEGGALTLLEDVLKAAGFHAQRLKFDEVDNLFAWIGSGHPHLCFAGHTDVVPPGDAAMWSHPPFAGEVSGGFMYGRGATDMKGSVAAFAAAALDSVKESGKPSGTLSFLITGDEEGPAINGTVKVLDWMKANGHVPDHCLVGEPTCAEALGDTIKIGRRGSLSFTVTVTGKQGHAAYPHKADNPVPKLAALVLRLHGAAIDQGNANFDPSTLAITSFDVGNPAGNVIPAKATLKFNIRFSTEQSFQSLKAWVQAQMEIVRGEHGGSWTLSSLEGADAFITEPGAFVGMVIDAVQEETGVVPKLSTSGGTSDARFIKDHCPVMEFGPTNATIHEVDERIAVAELEAVTRIYRRIIDAYFVG
jgi:succinyl-diaminopimelate desuccinylase